MDKITYRTAFDTESGARQTKPYIRLGIAIKHARYFESKGFANVRIEGSDGSKRDSWGKVQP